MKEQVKNEIKKLVDGSRDAIVCSVDGNGFPNAKAMFLRCHEGLDTFWFSTNVSAARTNSWQKNPKTCLYFVDPAQIHGLMLTGEMQIFTDEETKRIYWEEGDEQYYPQGPTDPDYCMARFIPEHGNYWGGGKYEFNMAEIME